MLALISFLEIYILSLGLLIFLVTFSLTYITLYRTHVVGCVPVMLWYSADFLLGFCLTSKPAIVQSTPGVYCS